jgi:hypothetical protein
MSDQDDHGEQGKKFLSRWSQRKQEAKRPDREAPAVDADAPSLPVTESKADPEFDLSSLPKLEEITSTTDITAFLRKGVPEHLRNAALRKSWALDPAIRNYVNPALEYAYDWNTPGGVPGSSEIGAGMDVARLVSQIMGSGESAIEPSIPGADSGKEPASDPAQSRQHNATQELEPGLPTQALRSGSGATSRTKENSEEEGVCNESEQAKDFNKPDYVASQQAVRRHGSAKPID